MGKEERKWKTVWPPCGQEVDRLDDQIAELFLKRMEVTGRIGACKEELGLPLMDPRRELEVLRSAAAETLDEGRKLELAHLFETVLALSRRGPAAPGGRERSRSGIQPMPEGRGRRAAAGGETQGGLSGRGGGIQRDGLPAFFGEDCRCQGLPTFEEVFQTVARRGGLRAWCPSKTAPTGAIRQVYEAAGQV